MAEPLKDIKAIWILHNKIQLLFKNFQFITHSKAHKKCSKFKTKLSENRDETIDIINHPQQSYDAIWLVQRKTFIFSTTEAITIRICK